MKSKARRAARVLYRPSVLATMAILIGGLVAAPHVRRLTKELMRQPIYLVEGGEVRISKPHDWVRRDFFEAAVEKAGLTSPLSVADPTLVEKLRLGLEASPWVASVDHIEATLQDGVEIRLTYRRPSVMVQTLNGLFPVDTDGVLLPPGDFKAEDAKTFPRLVIFDASHAGTVGTRWRDPRVIDAAHIASTLNPIDGDSASIWARCKLSEIRPAEADDTIFELQAANGSRVVWGHVGIAAQDIEPTEDQKIAKLEQILAERGSLAAPAGPYLIDLRRWDVVTLEPLAVSVR